MAAKQPHKRPLPNGYISKGGKDAYEVHDNYQPTPHYMTSNPKAFHVRVHANNNQFEPAKVMTIATNKIKTFENFLEECTDKLKPPFGAARRLYTPSGRRRIQQLDQLHEDSIYVITGNEPFKRINYREIPDRLRPARHKRFKKIDIDRIYKVVQHAKDEHYRQKSGQCLRRNAQEQGLILEVSVNGRISKPWFQMCIKPTSRNDIEKIKIAIQDTMQLNVIKKIYKVINCGGHPRNFIEITDPRDLNRFDHVLVIEGKEVLKPFLYRQDGLTPFQCPKSPRHIGLQGLFPPPEPVFPNRLSVIPKIGSSKQSDADTMSPLSNPSGSHGGRKTKRSKGHREVDYDKDEAGVFRAKKQNNSRGAHQEKVDENAAATKIQAGAKGYKARKDFAKMKEAKKREEENKRRQEKEAERFEEDLRQKEDEARNKEKKKIDEHEAATKIQAQFKGYKTRKAYKAGKQQVRESFDKPTRKEKEINAATKIQSGYRGYIARKNYNNKKKQMKKTDINDNEKENIVAKENAMNDFNDKGVREGKMSQNEAAVAIQAGYKGYKTRKEYAKKKSKKEKNLVENEADQYKSENAAASKIQANFRGYKVRKDFANEKKNKEEKEAHQAATKIQASFRGYRSRKQNTKKKEPQLPDQAPSPKLNDADELNKAATKIQSGFRGMKARKYYKSKVKQ